MTSAHRKHLFIGNFLEMKVPELPEMRSLGDEQEDQIGGETRSKKCTRRLEKLETRPSGDPPSLEREIGRGDQDHHGAPDTRIMEEKRAGEMRNVMNEKMYQMDGKHGNKNSRLSTNVRERSW